MEDRDLRFELAQIRIRGAELLAGGQRLVDHRARRQRNHVERRHLPLDFGFHAEARQPQICAREHPLADQHLPRFAGGGARMVTESGGIDGDPAPAQRRETLAADERIDARLQRQRVGRLAGGKEDHADGELVLLRQPAARREEAGEERPIDAQQQPGAVAGALDPAAAVLQAAEAAHRQIDDLARGCAGVGDGSHSAAAAARVFPQPLCQIGWVHGQSVRRVASQSSRGMRKNYAPGFSRPAKKASTRGRSTPG